LECRVYKRLKEKKENKEGTNSYRERKLITRSQNRAGSRS
jgi:hypothetical protein